MLAGVNSPQTNRVKRRRATLWPAENTKLRSTHMLTRFLFTLALAVGAANPLAANPVTFWNSVAGQAFIPTQGADPVGQSRIFPILHPSIPHSLNAIESRYQYL